ncbi:MAG: twin-arginine translocation signal domain-containing protein, partial [Tannerella sp.]|nr:twin-arginine translocation signal domain-containing protein [Tannerella sp.]
MSETKKSVNRRDFIRGLGISTVAVAGTGSLLPLSSCSN